jgi:glycosyltransferase involved in cell wall biosynthesis
VRTLGFVTDVPRLMATADILLLPTATEGSALVTYEAMGSGVVLLASEAAGADARHDEDALIHAVGDVDELTRQLDRLDCDRGLLTRLRARGLQRRDELSWAAAGARLSRVYRDRLSRGRYV